MARLWARSTGSHLVMEINSVTIEPIGYIRSDFKEKFGVPRQSGRAPSLLCELVFLPPYKNADCLRGIEGFSHLWLLFDFSQTREAGWSATVRPPRLGGNKRVGVFASRSPFRPNHIGLSCVKLVEIKRTENEGIVLVLSGADLLDGTPVFDVKPYLPAADCKPEAIGGYADEHAAHRLEVDCPQALLEKIPETKRAGLLECLADDPRPSYQSDPTRVYGMAFAGFEIGFTVAENILHVLSIQK